MIEMRKAFISDFVPRQFAARYSALSITIPGLVSRPVETFRSGLWRGVTFKYIWVIDQERIKAVGNPVFS
jgi:hypothetical protein